MEQLSIASTKTPDYGKLFADGKLNTTIGVGFDEGGYDKHETKDVIAGLAKQGYTQLDPDKAATHKATADGLQYFTKTFQYNGKDVTSVVKLITADTPHAKDQFAKAMASSEMVIYSGHGRYGSGPDFDDIKSPKGNFVIGKPGHVALNKGQTDLQKTAMTKDYQLMMFDGCTTNHYLNGLRAVPGKDSKNLDLVVFVGTRSGTVRHHPIGRAAHRRTGAAAEKAGAGTSARRRRGGDADRRCGHPRGRRIL